MCAAASLSFAWFGVVLQLILQVSISRCGRLYGWVMGLLVWHLTLLMDACREININPLL